MVVVCTTKTKWQESLQIKAGEGEGQLLSLVRRRTLDRMRRRKRLFKIKWPSPSWSTLPSTQQGKEREYLLSFAS